MLISARTPSFVSKPHILRSRLAKRVRAFARPDGGALVELGVSLPIIFLLMTGIFAFSIAMYQKLALSEGVSAGARTLAADRGNDTDPCNAAVKAVYAAAPTLTQGSFTFAFTFVTPGGTTTTNGTSCSGTVLTYPESGQVQATYPCALRAYGLKFSACTLSYAVTEEIQ